MHDSKLIALLRTFRTRDFRRFREYLASPFFNKREDLVRFYGQLLQFGPDFSEETCTREAVWAAYAPGQAHDSKMLNYLSNFLLEAAENYVATEALQQDSYAQGVRLLGYYLGHDLPKHYRSTLLRTRKALQAAPYRDSEWHLKAWRVADLEMQQFYASRTRKADNTIRQVQAHLDAFYLDRTFELGTELFSLNQMFRDEYDTRFVEDLLAVTDPQAAAQPTIRIRQWIFRMHLSPEAQEPFDQLLAILPKIHEYYPPERVKGIFAYAQNHCIRRIRAGESHYEALLFRIYKESIGSGMIYENGRLSPWDFKNVCSIALKLGEFAWTAAFIEREAPQIAATFRASAMAYNTGNLHFHQQQFDAALRALAKVEFSDIYYALDTRRIMLMIYYQRQDVEGMASLIPAFRSYLKRVRGISEQNRIAYKHFVDWVARLGRMSSAELQRTRPELAAQLAETQPLIAREWLVEQLGMA